MPQVRSWFSLENWFMWRIDADRDRIRILCNDLIPDGTIALYKGGLTVWVGPVGSPIEDVDFDEIMLSPNDYRILTYPDCDPASDS